MEATKMTAEQLGEKALTILEKIGGTVGETATELWPHAVRYVWATGLAQMIFSLLFGGIVAAVCLVVYRRLAKWDIADSTKADRSDKACGLVVTLLILLVSTGFCLWFFTKGLILVLEPTGATLKLLLSGIV